MTSYTVALTEPVRQHHTYEDKQYATCLINRDAKGFAISAHFSNGKKLDGDHFACGVVLKSADDTPIAAALMKCGINATFFGGTKERTLETRIDLTAEENAKAEKAEIIFEQPNTRDDIAIIKAIGEAIKTVYEIFFEPPPPKPPAPTQDGELPR